MSRIHNHAVDQNPHLVGVVAKLKAAKGLGPGHFNMAGSVCSFMLQEYEIRVLEQMYNHTLASGYIKNGVCTLAADGIMLKSYDPNLLTDLSRVAKDTVGFSLVFTQKAMDKGYGSILNDHLLTPSTTIEAVAHGSSGDVFKNLVVDFEKYHTKIIDDSLFVKVCSNGEIVMMSERNMIVSYKHIQCGLSVSGLPVCLIDKWLSFNDGINRKNRMEVYPDVDNCPDDVFNLWRPFAMETKTDPYVEHPEDLAMMLNHLRVLCGNETPIYDYFIGWIAMMIQRPEIKTACVTFISNQGSGKGTMMELFAKMLGEKKIFETASPSRDVWGHFNGLMVNAFLVNLNEMEMSEVIGAEAQFKHMVTDQRMTINNKGVPAYNIRSHHHFIVTTNKESPLKTSDDDRRNLIIRSSDELKGNRAYFDKFHALLGDENVIRTCYDYFKNYDLSGFNHVVIPKTEHQNNLKSLSTSPIEQWLEQFTRDHFEKSEVELLGADIFALFSDWCLFTKTKYETTPLKLGVNLANLKIDGIDKGRHTRTGKTKLFNIRKLRERYHLNGLLEF